MFGRGLSGLASRKSEKKKQGHEVSILRTVGLTKDFIGIRAINKLDITIEKGAIHGLIGPNGAGKTTFLNLVTGLLPPTEGNVYFESTEITGIPSYAITKIGIGRTFQKALVMDRMNVLENVMSGLHCRTKADFLGTYFRPPFRPSKQEERMKQRVS